MIVTSIAVTLLAAAAFLCLLRMLRGESHADRIIALDSLLLVVVSGLAVGAAASGEDTYLNAMAVTALLGFTGTSLVAKFIERRGP